MYSITLKESNVALVNNQKVDLNIFVVWKKRIYGHYSTIFDKLGQ